MHYNGVEVLTEQKTSNTPQIASQRETKERAKYLRTREIRRAPHARGELIGSFCYLG